MSAYLLIRAFHMLCAILSFSGFALRGYWMLKESPKLQSKPAKVLPHIVDTLLLLSAIVLVIMSGFYPITTSWINIKIVLLIAYIVLGTIALKRGKTKQIRTVTFVLALISVLAIFAVASIKP